MKKLLKKLQDGEVIREVMCWILAGLFYFMLFKLLF